MGEVDDLQAAQDANISYEISQLFAGWEQGLYTPSEFLNLCVELAIKVDSKAI